MTVVRLRSDILRADRATSDRWYVTNGATAVGPVGLELVERGVEAGKIPVDSYIRHELWKIWRPLAELCVTEAPQPMDSTGTPVMPTRLPLPSFPSDTGSSTGATFDPRKTTMKPAMAPPPVLPLETVAAADPAGVGQPLSTSMPAVLSLQEPEEVDPDDVIPDETVPRIRVPPAAPSVEDITLPARAPKPTEKVTADPLSDAAQLKDALLTLSGVILREVGCTGVMVHRVDDEGAVAVVAHGPRMFDVLGLRTRLLDPAIVAAAAGILVIAEPTPGPAGQSILSRLEKLGVNGTGAAMIPIRPNGRLFGTVELGQSGAFDGAALAKAESYVRVVQSKMEVADWFT